MAGKKGRRTADVYLEDEWGRVKVCSRCRIPKPIEDYHADPSNRWGIKAHCKECNKVDAWRRNQTRAKRNHLWSKWRMTEQDFKDKLESQGFACAICGNPDSRQALCVDHDHACCSSKQKSCGKCIRSLLCSDCNLGLGRFYDNPDLLYRAVDYIMYWRKEHGSTS